MRRLLFAAVNGTPQLVPPQQPCFSCLPLIHAPAWFCFRPQPTHRPTDLWYPELVSVGRLATQQALPVAVGLLNHAQRSVTAVRQAVVREPVRGLAVRDFVVTEPHHQLVDKVEHLLGRRAQVCSRRHAWVCLCTSSCPRHAQPTVHSRGQRVRGTHSNDLPVHLELLAIAPAVHHAQGSQYLDWVRLTDSGDVGADFQHIQRVVVTCRCRAYGRRASHTCASTPLHTTPSSTIPIKPLVSSFTLGFSHVCGNAP